MEQTMKRTNRNILKCLGIIVGYLVIYKGTGYLFRQMHFSNEYVEFLITYCCMVPILVGIAYGLGKKEIFHFCWGSFGKGMLVAGLFFMISLGIIGMTIANGVKTGLSPLPWYEILVFILAILVGTGFSEEVLFRGIVQGLLTDRFGKDSRKALFKTAFVTALLFGLTHLSNYFTLENADLGSVLSQVVNAAALGLCFSAIYFRSENIWVNVFVHGLWDLALMFSSGVFGVGGATDGLTKGTIEKIGSPELIQEYMMVKNVILVIFCLLVVTVYMVIFLFLMRKKKTLPLLKKDNTELTICE